MFLYCTQPFDFDSGTQPNLLVVDGRIDNTGLPQIVKLFRSFDPGELGQNEFNANVSLIDNLGNVANYKEDSNTPGTYILNPGNFSIGIGITYHLRIQLNDGEIYESVPQTMPESIKPDTMTFELEIDDRFSELNFVNLFVNTPLGDRPDKVWFRWEINEAFNFLTEQKCDTINNVRACYVTDVPIDRDKIFIYHSESSSIRELRDFRLSKRGLLPHQQFNYQHYFTAFQYSITEEAFNYWDNINKLSNQQGTFFDPVPGSVRGNIFNVNDPEEKVLGFFEVASVDTVRTFTTPDLLEPHEVERICPPCDSTVCDTTFWMKVCCDCSIIPNSTEIRPEYWKSI
ncbi:MAG TPA: DUF4249 domain-containing protein [Cyclobacteriaceae bacterium]